MFTVCRRIGRFYLEGFRAMVLGRTLWKWVLFKLVVLLLLGQVFLPDYLQEHFTTDRQRAAYVLDRLTDRPALP